MPLLRRKQGQDGSQTLGLKNTRNKTPVHAIVTSHEDSLDVFGNGIFPRCANPRCASGWLRLWRSRRAPIFEGGWCCSAECTRTRLQEALSREKRLFAGAVNGYRHRIPLGLSMLENGWITKEDLRGALEAQRASRSGRIGQWLIRRGAASEPKLARALALQWSCPVLDLDWHDPESMATMIPRLFVDALGVVPLRVVAQKILYIASEDRPDPVLAVALERMTRLRVECGILEGSAFRTAFAGLLDARYAKVDLLEAATESGLLIAATEMIEDAHPAESRLVRVHDFYWLRIWARRQAGSLPQREEVRDIIFSLAMKNDLV